MASNTSENGEWGTATRRKFLLATGVAGLGVAGHVSAAQDQELSGEISISGSSTVYPVSTAVAEEFSREHPNVNISVSRDGTSAGFNNAFLPGNSDINDASRPISREEIQQAVDTGFWPVEFQIASDALTVIVNSENDWVGECMTTEQLAQIWSPDTAPETWADVNSDWPDEQFELFGPATTSGTFDYFTEEVVGEEDSMRSDFEGTEQDNLIVQGVGDSQYAMGYVPFAFIQNNPTQNVRTLQIDSGDGCVQPNLETAKSGEYPLARPLFIYVNSQRLQNKQALQEFVRFYLNQTDSTELIANQIGYVPQSEEDVQSDLQKLEQAINGQLTTTIPTTTASENTTAEGTTTSN
ncbi:phosphate ABC transporter substrate-binding protein PstS family protein [Halorussus sp. AFM4]|uniref:PstS family phosphate ABC transporter substrate-binding protein n=1 Tax=Halorussus sp. AFM4 TaxID=3421651 RepID=UPI003EBB4131